MQKFTYNLFVVVLVLMSVMVVMHNAISVVITIMDFCKAPTLLLKGFNNTNNYNETHIMYIEIKSVISNVHIQHGF